MSQNNHEGLSGRIADVFIKSKLTILLMVVFVAIGLYSTMLIPREEEPQIKIPIADIFIGYPGANSHEVESRVSKPLEKMISNIKGVEYVYSTSMNGQAMVIVQYYVGEDIERSIVKLYDEINKHQDEMPQGVTPALIKTRSIDDVPIMSLTLWSENYDDYMLKQIGEEVGNDLKKISDVSTVKIIGGRSRQMVVQFDKNKLNANNQDLLSVIQKLQGNNTQMQSGMLNTADKEIIIESGNFLQTVDDLENLIVGMNGSQPVYLKQVANISDGPQTPVSYVNFAYGAAHTTNKEKFPSEYPAVTLAIAKKKGADAMKIAQNIRHQVATLHNTILPEDVMVSETRNYGESASEKVSELLMHLMMAIFAVTLLVMLAMGWRGGLVVFLSVPTTFALTLFAYYFMDYTLNRITLFALVFVTGIVVDDSIIIAENMHRHFHLRRLPFHQAAIYAINEVGNPTILATFTVVAAILPMAFVSGLMGPYMSPMPIGASIAMIFSLMIALTITPYLGYIFLKVKSHDTDNHSQIDDHDMSQNKIYRIYEKFLLPLLESRTKRNIFLGTTTIILLISCYAFMAKWVAVKMLPFDNKNEFQIVVDMPEGTTLQRSMAVTRELSQYLSRQPFVESYQSYVGTASPITFNGLVRHYDVRQGSNVADIQVNLTHKDSRKLQSHDLAKIVRPELNKIAQKMGANIKVVEVPPGPPVLSTLVAEIYGPDYTQQMHIAQDVRKIFETTPDVVDVDWYVEADQEKVNFVIDKEKAMLNGVAPMQIVHTMQMALSYNAVSTLYDPKSHNPVKIVAQLNDDQKTNLNDLKSLKVMSQTGQLVSIADLVALEKKVQDKNIYRKNQHRVVYVTADMAGEMESPVYAILNFSDKLKNIKVPSGYSLEESYNGMPQNDQNFIVKWDGEWQITFDVFRDLGIAFGVVIFIIYLLIVGWFQNFKVPIVMMIAIPLSLIGIVLGHILMGAFFTATSMIGFIALAGVMVRNSVLLIDFINIRIAEGINFKEAILESGAVRTTPILLTAGAVAIGAIVILFDPIFQGLAISLIGGTVASTFLTLIVVPLVYYITERKQFEKQSL